MRCNTRSPCAQLGIDTLPERILRHRAQVACITLVLPDEQHSNGRHSKEHGREGRARVFEFETDARHLFRATPNFPAGRSDPLNVAALRAEQEKIPVMFWADITRRLAGNAI